MKHIQGASFTVIIAILLFTLYGMYPLVSNEWTQGNICPKIIGIPACYIVFLCFSLGLIFHLIPVKNNYKIYLFFIGINTLIASVGSIGEWTGLTECPRTSGGIPMCYISLGICLSLITLKLVPLFVSKK